MGVINRMLDHGIKRITGDTAVLTVKKVNLTCHVPGHTSAAQGKDLTGPEITRWLHSSFFDDQVAILESKRDACLTAELKEEVTTSIRNLRKMEYWATQLQLRLTKFSIWTADARARFKALVIDIWHNWVAVTGDHSFPKLHMLGHLCIFTDDHGVLVEVSESTIEACHANVSRYHDVTHANSSWNEAQRLRRTLASVALEHIAPFYRCE